MLGGLSIASKKIQSLPELNEALFQKELAKRVPAQGVEYGIDWKIESANVYVNNEISFDIALKIDGYGYKADIQTKVVGAPYYDNVRKAFYFTPKEGTAFEFQKLKLKKKLGSIIKDAITSDGVVKSIVKGGIKNILVNERKTQEFAEKAITWYLNNLPVYKIPDDEFKWKVVGIALSEVRVIGDTVYIEVSFWALTKWVLLMLVALVISIVVTIVLISSGSATLWGLVIVGSAID